MNQDVRVMVVRCGGATGTRLIEDAEHGYKCHDGKGDTWYCQRPAQHDGSHMVFRTKDGSTFRAWEAPPATDFFKLHRP
jgi:hypothetical protein